MSDEWLASEGPSSTNSCLWKKIWGAQVLPRVKVFASRAMLEALPTRAGLSRRVASVDLVCGVCGATEEVGLHALRWCGLARGVWRKSGLQCSVPRGCSRVIDWWDACFTHLDDDDLAVFLTTCGLFGEQGASL